jgi:hypothetical protein
VNHPGSFTEILPLLLSEEDEISVNRGQIKLQTKQGMIVIHTSVKDAISVTEYKDDLNGKRCQVIHIAANNSISYEFEFTGIP